MTKEKAREYATRIRLGEPAGWKAIAPYEFVGVYKLPCGVMVWNEARFGIVSPRQLLEALDSIAK
jgi:hypothetical protein